MDYEQLVSSYVDMFNNCYAGIFSRSTTFHHMTDKFGLKRLGTGNSSTVFECKTNPYVVVKVSNNNEDGAVAYLTYCYVQQLNGLGFDWMPKIYSMYVDPVKHLCIVAMERLYTRVSKEQMVEWCKERGVICRAFNQLGHPVGRECHDHTKLSDDFLRMYCQLGKPSDLHSDNMMRRNDGTYVLTDPYHTVSRQEQNKWWATHQGYERFIRADYLTEVEALMGARGKPSIEPQHKSGLPAVQSKKGRVTLEPRFNVNPALFRMRGDYQKPLDEAAKAEVDRAARAKKLAEFKPGIWNLDLEDFRAIEQRAFDLARDAWPEREFVEQVRFQTEPWARRFATNERRQDRWNAIAGNQHWQRKQVPPKPFRG